MRKKVVALCLAVFFMLALSSSPLLASPTPANSKLTFQQISPFWVNVLKIKPEIRSSSFFCAVEGKAGTTSIQATLILYQLSGGQYVEVSRLTETAYVSIKNFSKSYTFASGFSYKLTSTVKVTCNGSTETVTQTVYK